MYSHPGVYTGMAFCYNKQKRREAFCVATVKDIAARCGVSPTTVSYVLNGKSEERHITAETTLKVLRAAEELGYILPKAEKREHPNTPPRVLILWPSSYPGQELMCLFSALEDENLLRQKNFEPEIKLYRGSHLAEEWERKEPDRYDLIIPVALKPKDMVFLSKTPHRAVIVTLNRRVRGCASVSIDNEAAGRMACDLLFSTCGKSVSAVFEEYDGSSAIGRMTRHDAFICRAKELNIPILKHTYQCSITGSYEEGYRLALDLIHSGSMTKGIFFTQDHTGIGFMAAMQKNGIQPGKDFYMLAAGLGSQDLCRFSSPPITALDMKVEETIAQAIHLGFEILDGMTPIDTVLTMQPGVIFRSTLPSTDW